MFVIVGLGTTLSYTVILSPSALNPSMMGCAMPRLMSP